MMSLVASRVGLKHRCTIERDAHAASLDPFGGTEAPDWQTHLDDLPCRGWENASREPVDADRTVTIFDRRLLVVVGTDVTECDRVVSVTDEAGNVVFDGPMGIEGVVRRPTHLELVLQRIR